jgi:hypothetical protein
MISQAHLIFMYKKLFTEQTHSLHISGYLTDEGTAYGLDNHESIPSMPVIFFPCHNVQNSFGVCLAKKYAQR